MPKSFYAVLRGRQPGVYSSRHSADAQVCGYPDAFQRGFDSLEEAEQWLSLLLGQRPAFYEARRSITRTHHIRPRAAAPPNGNIFLLWCDGASRGNPGPAGCGGCIWQPNSESQQWDHRVAHYQNYIGHATNNAAEYRALTRGLLLARGLGIRNIRVRLDSELVAYQSSGQWATHDPVMSLYRDAVQALLHEFDYWQIIVLPREQNHIADQFANAAIDEQSDGLVKLYVPNYFGDRQALQEWSGRVISKFQQYGNVPRIVITA